jgi:hypothetical protein
MTGGTKAGVAEQRGGARSAGFHKKIRDPVFRIQCCGTVTICYGSGSDFWKVMVPVPTFEKLWFRFLLLKKLRFRFQLHI